MQKISRQIFIETSWLALSLGFTTILTLFLFGRSFLNSTLDIHLHDTYFIIAPVYIVLPLFLLVTFIIYFVKEFRNSFRRKLSNWILIIAGLALVIGLTFLIKTFSQVFKGGWTIYPPLSALGPDKVSELTQEPVAKIAINFLTVIQIIIVATLLYVAYRWGTQRQIEKSEH